MANFFERVWSASMAAYKAFQSKYTTSDQQQLQNFMSIDARRLRYSIFGAMYENSAYDSVHSWVQSLKTDKGLYKYIRPIYNPSYRIGEFWKAKLLGGELDPQAGDGITVPSCLPILTENEELRPAIAQIWQWSNWQIKKDVFGLWTPILGDGVLKIVDDPLREKVFIKWVHPSRLKEAELDDYGNVKGYTLEYERPDPRDNRSTGTVTYKEVATRDGDNVHYATYLNGGLYVWDDNEVAEWDVPYGFVPMVVLQHNDVGLDFGWSELHPGLPKFREIDDQASKLNDQIRKVVEAPFLLAGVQDPSTAKTIKGTTQTRTTEKPQPERAQQKYLYSNDANAKAHSLVANLDIVGVVKNIGELLKEFERDYPELRVDLANATGDISGRALRINRSPAVAKVMQRRPNYDNAIVRIQQMAISIGGYRQYENFEKFTLDSFFDKKLDHSIGPRPVFENDPMDKLEEEGTFLDNVKKAKDVGIPLPVYLKQQGWSEEKISDIVNSEEYKLSLDARKNAVDASRAALTEGNMSKKPVPPKAQGGK